MRDDFSAQNVQAVALNAKPLDRKDAFAPVAPTMHEPRTGHGLNLGHRRPGTSITAAKKPAGRSAQQLSHPVRGMRMTSQDQSDNDDDFQAVVSRLAPTPDLPKLRESIRDLEQQMNDAVEAGDFNGAIRYRDEARDLLSQDPAPIFKETREAMWKAAEIDDFKGAAKYRDQLNTLKAYLPEYNLAGGWKGNVPDQGIISVDLGYTGAGDTVSGRYAGGDLLFEVDVSEFKESSKATIVYEGTTYAEYYEGTGHIDGKAYDGKLYLLADGIIGFSLKEDPNGGVKQLSFAGGGGGDAVIGGELGMRSGGGRGGAGGDPWGDGDGGLDLFIVFKRTSRPGDSQPQKRWLPKKTTDASETLERQWTPYDPSLKADGNVDYGAKKTTDASETLERQWTPYDPSLKADGNVKAETNSPAASESGESEPKKAGESEPKEEGESEPKKGWWPFW